MSETVRTTADVRKWIKRVYQSRYDDEGAHSSEDALYQAVLAAIADGTAQDPKAMAREALKTQSIDFARWCA